MKATWEEKQRAAECGDENSRTRRIRKNRLITRAQNVVGNVIRNDPQFAGFVDLVDELMRAGQVQRLTRGRIRVSCAGAKRICQVLDVIERIKEE